MLNERTYTIQFLCETEGGDSELFAVVEATVPEGSIDSIGLGNVIVDLVRRCDTIHHAAARLIGVLALMDFEPVLVEPTGDILWDYTIEVQSEDVTVNEPVGPRTIIKI